MRPEDYLMLFTFLLLLTGFLSWYIYLKTRNKERMALIEKDKDISEIFARPKANFSFRIPWLKVGIITTGFSIGWLVAILVQELINSQSGNNSVNSGAVIMGVIFLFTSVSILVAYFADKPKNKE
jgi:hypothetical protein